MIDMNEMDICQECLNPTKNIKADQILIVQDPKKEGIIEIRKGLSYLNLGKRVYAKIRLFIGTSNKYITGMAIYSDNIPDDYDLIFYTRLRNDGLFTGYGTGKRINKSEPLEIIEIDGVWDSWNSSIKTKWSGKK